MLLAPIAPTRQGAHPSAQGIDFTVFSRNADKIELCLFDDRGHNEIARLALPRYDGDFWSGRLTGELARPGLIYGYRAHGPYAPAKGHRFNPNKLLIDPYTHALTGSLRWHDAVFGYCPGDPEADRSFNPLDSAPFVPKSRVVQWPSAPDRPPKPRTPWADTVLYEAHVRGLTLLHPELPAALRGRFAGLAHPALIEHFRRLGISAIELLPVASWVDEAALVQRGLRNYWGYNPIAFMVPHPQLAGPGGVAELTGTVDALHAAGIEVILDVVYNHTAESDALGATLSWRGLDNAVYYRLDPHDRSQYEDFTGCGNTLAAHDPVVGALIVESLRFWATEVGVDGFRFDLASAIARDRSGGFDSEPAWIGEVLRDPELSRCKLIAESWDVRPDGYRVGRFGPGFAEWNDRFRDAGRRFWSTHRHGVGELATRLAGSEDLFGKPGSQSAKGPLAGIAYVTAHDGFTLADWASYRHKHNLPNGENNRDGSHENLSDPFGPEGPSRDAAVLALRQQRVRALLATLFSSHAVPMLRAGDEFGASQRGNNNAYCQDNPTSWIAWPQGFACERPQAPAGELDLRDFIGSWVTFRRQALLPLWQAHEALVWLGADGKALTESDWKDPQREVLVVHLCGKPPHPPPQPPQHPSQAERPGALCLVFNAARQAAAVTLPAPPAGHTGWSLAASSEPGSGDGPWHQVLPGVSLFISVRLSERHPSV